MAAEACRASGNTGNNYGTILVQGESSNSKNINIVADTNDREPLLVQSVVSSIGHNDDNSNSNNNNIDAKTEPNPRFRYLISLLIVVAITMNNYANYTLYIAAIEMISNDVLQSGMTQLREKHLSADPFAAGSNAAASGTCPVTTSLHLSFAADENDIATNSTTNNNQTTGTIITDMAKVSKNERKALANDSLALFADVGDRIAKGQLVDWTIKQRGYIFTAHNIGGVLMAIPISRFGMIYGSKIMMTICIVATALRMLLLPIIAGHAHYMLVFAFEFIFGGPGQSLSIIAYPLAAAWMLPEETNVIIAFHQTANLIGTALTNFISTQMLARDLDWSWCFYVPGIVLSLVGFAWIVLGADRPEKSRFITQEELSVLQRSLTKQDELKRSQVVENTGSQQLTKNKCVCRELNDQDSCPALKLRRNPNWSAIFKCPTIWALISVNFAYHWNAKIATLWPTFFSNILHLNPATIGIVTGLKGVIALLFGSVFACATRKLSINRPFNMSLTAYRRINQIIATLILSLSIGLMVLLDCDFVANIASVLLTPLVTGFNSISHEQMPLDLSAEDSGLIVSCIRLIAPGDIPSLPISSYILAQAHSGGPTPTTTTTLSTIAIDDSQAQMSATTQAIAGDRTTWRMVWSLGLAIKLVACFWFVLFARSKPKSYSRLEPSGQCKSISQ